MKFSFVRIQRIGKPIGKKTDSQLELLDHHVNVSQTIQKFLKKPIRCSYHIKYEDINAIKVKNHFNAWDLFLTAICVLWVVGGVFPFVLLGAILMWQSYGKQIVITTKQGQKYKIPADKHHKDIGQFISEIEQRI